MLACAQRQEERAHGAQPQRQLVAEGGAMADRLARVVSALWREERACGGAAAATADGRQGGDQNFLGDNYIALLLVNNGAETCWC